MNDLILTHAHDLMTSPWLYAALFAFAALDAVFPAFPSETLVILAGVFAATGGPDLVIVVAAAAAGAFVGDHVSYAIGRRLGHVLLARLQPGTKRHAAFTRAESALAERGGLVLVAARYVPGGRTAATLTMGTVGYRLGAFTCFTALAGVLWGVYCALVGYVGGKAFENDPVKGVVLGIGLALGVTVVVEGVRYVVRRHDAGPTPSPTPAPTGHRLTGACR